MNRVAVDAGAVEAEGDGLSLRNGCDVVVRDDLIRALCVDAVLGPVKFRVPTDVADSVAVDYRRIAEYGDRRVADVGNRRVFDPPALVCLVPRANTGRAAIPDHAVANRYEAVPGSRRAGEDCVRAARRRQVERLEGQVAAARREPNGTFRVRERRAPGSVGTESDPGRGITR